MLTKRKKEKKNISRHEKFDLQYKIIDKQLIVYLDFFLYKYALFGKDINLNIEYHADDHNQYNSNLIYNIPTKHFKINGHKKTVIFDLNKYNIYSYKGKYTNFILNLTIHINDRLLYPTIVKKEIEYFIPNKMIFPKLIETNKKLSFIENIIILPNHIQLITLLGSIIITIIIGYITYFYIKNRNIIAPLFISGLILLIFISLINKIFENYISFHFKKYKYTWNRNKVHKLSDIVGGKSKFNLNNVKIKVLATNIEKSLHIDSNGIRNLKHSKLDINGIILHEEDIGFIPKNTDFKKHINSTFSFNKMYDQLYPPINIGDYEHGIELEWKIQLISNNLIIKTIIGSNKFIKYKNFLDI